MNNTTLSAWDSLASHFDLHSEDLTRLDFASAANRLIAWPAIIQLLQENVDVESSRVVDFGCGTGALCTQLSHLGYDVMGVDQSSDMIKLATSKSPKSIQFVVGSLDTLANEKVAQAITCSLVLNYFLELSDFLKIAEQILHHGGILVTADLNRAYVRECIKMGLIYENFDSVIEPQKGLLNFRNGRKVPLTIRSEAEYDELLLKRGWRKAGTLYPCWTSEYLELYRPQLPTNFPLTAPKYQVLAYQRVW